MIISAYLNEIYDIYRLEITILIKKIRYFKFIKRCGCRAKNYKRKFIYVYNFYIIP